MTSKPKQIQFQKLIGTKTDPIRNSLSVKEAILYALGIGFSSDNLKEEDFKYTNEYREEFMVFSTVGVILPRINLLATLIESPYIPEFSVFQVLHAEHKLTMVKPQIKTDVEYEHEAQLIDCAVKGGKNAYFLFRGSSYQINQKRQGAGFSRLGLGGPNYQGKGLINKPVEIPKRNPDWKIYKPTFPNQAFFYRLSLDTNPLHIDPSIAKAQKFQRPILHGLASFGGIARVFVQKFLNNDPTQLKTFQSRFVGHVYPGETLEVNFWKEGEIFIYEAKVQERGTQALIGYIEVRASAKL